MSSDFDRELDAGTDGAESPSRSPLWRFWRWLGLGTNGESSLKESLAEVLDEHETAASEDSFGEDERSMLMNVLRYGELHIDDVMVPRADITAIEVEAPFREVIGRIAEASHSRLPVYRESLDDVIGMVHVKDVLRVIHESEQQEVPKEVSLRSLLRPVLFVPPSMKLLDVLAKMRSQRTHMAIVIDEYGGSDGLVTIEDLVEEIVGEIEDEHDERQGVLLERHGEHAIDADARAPVEDIERVLRCDLLPDERDEDIDTIGGLVVSLEGRVPGVGEMVTHPLGYRFEVMSGDARRLLKVRIHTDAVAPEDGAPRANGGNGD